MKVRIDSTEFANMLLLLKEGRPQLTLTEEDIELSDPREVDPTVTWEQDDPNKRPLDLDTEITITAKPGSPRYKGNANYKYRRKNIERQWLVLNGSLSVSWTPQMISNFNPAGIKAYIKSRMPHIETSIIMSVSNYEADQGSCNVNVKPIDNSLIYKGEMNLSFSKNTDSDKTPIDVAIPNNLLDGFDYNTTVDLDELSVLGFRYSGRPNP